MKPIWAAGDRVASELAEGRRFPFCTPEGLGELMRGAGLVRIECKPIEIPTVFSHFEAYWHPFTLRTGPAPGYCTNLDPEARQRLKEMLHNGLPRREDGAISFKARAWAIKAIA